MALMRRRTSAATAVWTADSIREVYTPTVSDRVGRAIADIGIPHPDTVDTRFAGSIGACAGIHFDWRVTAPMRFEALWQDLRHGLRVLRTRPSFTGVAVLTLAVGIGANTSIFTAVHALLLRPLPLERADRLVYGVSLREGFDPFATSLLEYSAYRRSAGSFESMGIALRRAMTLRGAGEPERFDAAEVTSSFLATIGVKPQIGRTLSRDDERSTAAPVTLLAYELWQTRFGGRSDIVGTAVRLDDRSYTVAGVMPAGFDFPSGAHIWVPIQVDIETLPLDQRAGHAYTFVGRLAKDVELRAADTELKAIAARLEQDYPEQRRGWSYTVVPLRQQLLGDLSGRVQRGLMLLVAAVGLVLVICCANVASLLLMQGVARERELALRAALGAERARLLRQLFTESMLLSIVGGTAGVLLSLWIAPVLARLNPVRADALADVLTSFSVDWRSVTFAIAISLATGVLFGLAPAAKAARVRDPTGVLKRHEQRTGRIAGSRAALSAVIIGEVAMAAALLVAGGLVVKSFQRLQRADLGFRPDHLLVAQIPLADRRYPSQDDRVRLSDEILRRIHVLPGVDSAGLSTNLPLDAVSLDSMFTVEGAAPRNPGDVPITAHRMVSPRYLQTLGVRLRQGRLLDEHDRAGSLPVAVVSAEFARQSWPNENPIGKRVRRGGPARTDMPWLTIVGVVDDVKEDLFNFRINRPVWYLPYSQVDTTQPLSLVIHTVVEPTSIARAVRDAVHAVDADLPVANVRTMTSHVAEVTAADRFGATLIGTLAVVGLGLAAIGLYGVIAYSVAQRTGEIGLRMALGSPRGLVLVMVLREGATLLAIGLVAGMSASKLLTHALAGMLYDVRPDDPGAIALVSALLVIVGLGASLVPAYRATRIDPIQALRYD